MQSPFICFMPSKELLSNLQEEAEQQVGDDHLETGSAKSGSLKHEVQVPDRSYRYDTTYLSHRYLAQGSFLNRAYHYVTRQSEGLSSNVEITGISRTPSSPSIEPTRSSKKCNIDAYGWEGEY